jgi:hypothetical protein
MSKQVNFYVTPEDTTLLEDSLRDIESFVVLHSRSDSSKPRILANLDYIENGQQWLYLFLVRPDDLDSVSMRYVPAQDYWTVDVLKSPVIELNRCFFDGQILRRGRIYYIGKFYGTNDELIAKPEPFQKWANSVFKTTKKALNKINSDYFGRNAQEWLTSGGALA